MDLAIAPYPERAPPPSTRPDRLLQAAHARIAPKLLPPVCRLARCAELVEDRSKACAGNTDGQLLEAAQALRAPLLHARHDRTLVARAFAIVRELTHRHLGLRHHSVQLMGGWAMHEGRLAEMQPGEGKTITALLPAMTAALAGEPVHVITVNDYLAERDAAQLKPVYEAVGLSVGVVLAGQEPAARRAAYACDVTYCTNKELVFDYLRDRAAVGARRGRARLLVDELCRADARGGTPLLLRGLHFGIVDEADSVLIDEARTPLILSSSSGESDAQLYESALELAGELAAKEHYVFTGRERTPSLTDTGRERVRSLLGVRSGLWSVRRAREELIEQALTAVHSYRRDVHYIVAEGKVQIVDEYTGRVMPDRSWERGLHQMIEAKEQCAVTGQRRTLAKITYQRFFRRYVRLAGMTGTATEAAGELAAVYGLRTVRIPTNRPQRRRDTGAHVFVDANAKWQAVVSSARRTVQEHGRPVLIGTRSVAASEYVASLLAAAGIAAEVLNARQDSEEAAIVARAGESGRVTVATNMAGRGTDIRLSPQAAAAGGLHVILTEYHESIRIDRQLFGRAARQGDPGTFEALVALDDELFARFAPAWRKLACGFAAGIRDRFPPIAGRALRWVAQTAAERHYAKVREATVSEDERTEKLLSFAGRGE